MDEFIKHIAGSAALLMEARRDIPKPESLKPATGLKYEYLHRALNPEYDPCPFDADLSPSEAVPPPDWEELERRKKEQLMNRMCGRWTPGANRCGVEIVRRGDFLTLNYLKRKGGLHDERFVLLWYDDNSFLFYGHSDRVTSVTLDAETDTLMISPGVDYTRVVEPEQ